MSDIYGHLFGMPFARYDPDTQSWRTSPDTSLLDWEMSSLTLPKSGGMRSGQLYEHPTSEPATNENDFLSLPTPTAQDGANTAGPSQFNRNSLPLNVVAVTLLPTPTVNDMGAGKDPEKWQEWTQKMRDSHKNGNGHGKSLEQEAISLIGANTLKQSDDGKTPLDDWHQHQLSWADTTNPD